MDLIFVGLTVALFAVAWAAVWGFDRLLGDKR
jgi:hypothetical protein